jgi:hypothetical protein
MQFIVLFHLFAHGHPMVNLLQKPKPSFVVVENEIFCQKTCDSSGWSMTEVMHIMLLEATKVAFVVISSW